MSVFRQPGFSTPVIGAGAYVPGHSEIPSVSLVPRGNFIGDSDQRSTTFESGVNVGVTTTTSPVEYNGRTASKHQLEMMVPYTLWWTDTNYPPVNGKTCLMSVSDINYRLKNAHADLRKVDAAKELAIEMGYKKEIKTDDDAAKYVDDVLATLIRRGQGLVNPEDSVSDSGIFQPLEADRRLFSSNAGLDELIKLNLPGWVYSRYRFAGVIVGAKTGVSDAAEKYQRSFTITVGTHRHHRVYPYWSDCMNNGNAETQVGAVVGFMVKPASSSSHLQLVPWSSSDNLPVPMGMDKFMTYKNCRMFALFYTIGTVVRYPRVYPHATAVTGMSCDDPEKAKTAIGRVAATDGTMEVSLRTFPPLFYTNLY